MVLEERLNLGVQPWGTDRRRHVPEDVLRRLKTSLFQRVFILLPAAAHSTPKGGLHYQEEGEGEQGKTWEMLRKHKCEVNTSEEYFK